MEKIFDTIVVGAGAAGMMCAAQAGQRGKRVLLIDHYHKLGEKIRISGGGHCNFTNLHCKPENFLSQNPHFCRSALARYTPQHFISLIEKHKIRYHEKKLGQLFCNESAQQIIDLLKLECDEGNVEWAQPCQITSIKKAENYFLIDTNTSRVKSQSLVIATGGLSIPKIGATPFGYRIAEQFGLKIIPPRPALVPLTFSPETLEQFKNLSGISIDAVVSCRKGEFRENILLTHRGLSGPAILQISSYWNGSDFININLLPDLDIENWITTHHKSRVHLNSVLSEILPKRFAQHWCEFTEQIKPMDQFSTKALTKIIEDLQNWRIKPSGTLGYNKAEVTLGGIDTNEISSKTMESTKIKGLYFIGEVVDVTGHLGGFNFQWAWSSAHAAAQAI